MKEHESKELSYSEKYYWIRDSGGEIMEGTPRYHYFKPLIYVDSNNYLHNLDGYAYNKCEYFIHGKQYKTKEGFDIERNRILILDELETI